MTDERFQEIEALIEDSGRVFSPDAGTFEAVDTPDDETDSDLDSPSFLAALGITAEECAEYVQRKIHEYDDEFRNA
jgi:hypothetical protein